MLFFKNIFSNLQVSDLSFKTLRTYLQGHLERGMKQPVQGSFKNYVILNISQSNSKIIDRIRRIFGREQFIWPFSLKFCDDVIRLSFLYGL